MQVDATQPTTDGLIIPVHDDRGRSFELTYRAPGPLHGPDAALAASLFPAMRRSSWDNPTAETGNVLDLAEPVSPTLLDTVPQIQDILRTWDKALRPGGGSYGSARVSADRSSEISVPDGRGVACLFTAGVDSFYSVLRNREQIDTLVFIHGFDTSIEPGALRTRLADGVRAAADELGLPLIEVATDLRRFSDEIGVHWLDYHGAALASVAHLLGHQFRKVILSATSTYADLHALGSHPLLDPLWSSDLVQIVHHGAEATRVEKVEAISDNPAARRWLRVCWENRDDAYNCGRCEKCLRTMVALRIAGVAERFASLPPLSLWDVAKVRIPGRGGTWHSQYRLLEATGTDPDLRKAMRIALSRHRVASLRTGAVPHR